jgi:hypothetical protein
VAEAVVILLEHLLVIHPAMEAPVVVELDSNTGLLLVQE